MPSVRALLAAATELEVLGPVVAAAVGAAAGAAATWRKSKPESESIATQTLKGVIVELRLELDRKAEEIEQMRARLNEVDRHLSAMTGLPPEAPAET